MKKLTKQQIQVIEAIKQGNFNEVHHLVSQGVDLNFRDENLDTVFSVAAYHGQIRIIDYLIMCEQNNINITRG